MNLFCCRVKYEVKITKFIKLLEWRFQYMLEVGKVETSHFFGETKKYFSIVLLVV